NSAGLGGVGPAANTSKFSTKVFCTISLGCSADDNIVLNPCPLEILNVECAVERRISASTYRTFLPACAQVTAVFVDTVVFPSEISADVNITTCNVSNDAPANSMLVRNVLNCSEITFLGSTTVTNDAPLSCVLVSLLPSFFLNNPITTS